MHQPNDIVTPDEIYKFIRQSAVSEESATGIKLLRRAADTITWNNSELYRLEDRLEGLDGKEQGQTNFDEQWRAAGAQISEALGFGENLSFEGILKEIHDLREFKDRLDEPCSSSVGDKAYADGNSYGELGEVVDPNEWAKLATNFAHTVYGFSLATDSPFSHRISDMADKVINESPVK